MSTIVERLEALRALMRARKINAYIVCTDDFHGSEYVGSYFKAREYMSGYTGSAGTLVVTENEACLWTDGRYFLQAAKQLEGSTVILQKMGQPNVPDIGTYLADKLPDGSCVGFDGRTVTDSFVGRISEKLAGRKITYFCGEDLVDFVWTDRPKMSKEPVWILPDSFTGLSRADKISGVRKALKEKGCDVLVLTALDDIAWLLNLRGNDIPFNPVFLAYMMIDADNAVLYADESIFGAEVRNALDAAHVTVKAYDFVYDELGKLPAGIKVMVDKSTANYRIVHSIPSTDEVVADDSPVVLPKAVKTPEEMNNERKAHIKDGVAVTHFIYWLKQNVGKSTITELDAAKKLDEFRSMQEGYLGHSFEPIMGYGEHGAIIHYEPTPETDVKLEPASFLLSDTGGHYYEGTTDITRTIALGSLTDEEKKMFTLVLRGHLNLAAAKFVYGVKGENLDYIARQPLWEYGLDYNHGTGHGVGYILNVHERPNGIRWRVTKGGPQTAVFEEGMITSNEPGFYLEGKFGIRHESLVLCRALEKTEYGQFMGFETLTMVPFDLDAVDVSYMTKEEVERLNEYHEKVYTTISPYFEGEELEWLKNATRKLSKD